MLRPRRRRFTSALCWRLSTVWSMVSGKEMVHGKGPEEGEQIPDREPERRTRRNVAREADAPRILPVAQHAPGTDEEIRAERGGSSAIDPPGQAERPGGQRERRQQH